MRLLTEDLTADERNILAQIREHAVHVVAVAARGDEPDYAYTVGLWHSFAHPEVVVFGLPPQVATDLLELVADEVAGGEEHPGRKFDAGVEADDLLEGYRACFLPVTNTQHERWFATARWAYEGDAFRVVQLVYPDAQGRWPWQDGVAAGFRRAQPVIAEQQV